VKTVLVFAVLIAVPLCYLWENAHTFGLCQRVARLQEAKQRQREICDSLAACLGRTRSSLSVAAQAGALGLDPAFRFGPGPQPTAGGLATVTPRREPPVTRGPTRAQAGGPEMTRAGRPAAQRGLATKSPGRSGPGGI
jgi:hypothetical protein